MTFPVEDPADLYHFTDLNQFLDIYGVVCASLQTADDFHRITYECLEDAVEAGVRYREMFFSPGFVIKLGVPAETVWAGVSAAVVDARADLDIGCRMILDFDKPSGAGHALEMADFAGAQDRDLLIGMGADSVERVDHRPFAAAYEAAGRHGLKRTMHAGEDGPSDNIAIAVREFGCDRVDHGFRLLDDPELTAEIVDRQIPLTVCPTSNVMIANVVPDVASHPYARQRELGVLATLNSDDPGMMRFDVADEYAAVAQGLPLQPRGDGGHQPRRHHRFMGARRREGRAASPIRGRIRPAPSRVRPACLQRFGLTGSTTVTGDADLASFVQGLPKAELHLHIEGTLEPAQPR